MKTLSVLPKWLSTMRLCEPIVQVIKQHDRVCIVGDGKLGLLIAQLIASRTPTQPVHFGRHEEKLALVEGTRPVVFKSLQDLDESYQQVLPWL